MRKGWRTTCMALTALSISCDGGFGETNEPPVAVDDLVQTTEGTPIVIDVLANDQDEHADSLGVESVGAPFEGSAEIVEGRSVRYTPRDGYVGVDVFDYTVRDGGGRTGEGTVTVIVVEAGPCEPGESQCSAEGNLLACPDGTGWVATLCEEGCEVGAEGARCVEGCSSRCDAGETRCADETIEACAAGDDGCVDWAPFTDCAASGQVCDDSTEPARCVDAGSVAPVITEQPEDRTATVGETVSFTVRATCPDPMGFNWWDGEARQWVDGALDGRVSIVTTATSSTLTLEGVEAGDDGLSFTAEVYNTLDHPNLWINSEPATLTVAGGSATLCGANGCEPGEDCETCPQDCGRCDPPARAATYFIDPIDGDDTRSGRSEAEAWASFAPANELVGPGDVVEVIGDVTLDGRDDAIAPHASGEPGRPIVFRARAGDRVVIATNDSRGLAVDVEGLSYIEIRGFTIITQYWMRAQTADHIVFADNHCSHLSMADEHSGHPPVNLINASYCTVRGNWFEDGFEHYSDIIEALRDSHHHVIEGNVFLEGSHTAIHMNGNSSADLPDGTEDGSPRWNAIRGNYFFSRYHHGLNIQIMAHHNLIDGNFFERSGSGFHDIAGDRHPTDSDLGSSCYGSHRGVIRRNIFIRAGDYSTSSFSSAAIAAHSYNNTATRGNHSHDEQRVYNNVIYRAYGLAVTAGAYVVYDYDPPLSSVDNQYVNNIIFMSGEDEERSGDDRDVAIYYHNSNSADATALGRGYFTDRWANNIIETPDERPIDADGLPGPMSVEEVEASGLPGWDALEWVDNFAADPMLTDPDGVVSVLVDDETYRPVSVPEAAAHFRLRSGSPALDAGVPLTRTTTAGAGVEVPVEDARWFVGGSNPENWDGIIPGDVIMIGAQTVTIESIDYDGGVLTVNRSVTWEEGAPVSLPYRGSAPDIGAFESND